MLQQLSACQGRESQEKEEGEGEGASYEWHHRVDTRRIRQVPWGEVGRMREKVDVGKKGGGTDNRRMRGKKGKDGKDFKISTYDKTCTEDWEKERQETGRTKAEEVGKREGGGTAKEMI